MRNAEFGIETHEIRMFRNPKSAIRNPQSKNGGKMDNHSENTDRIESVADESKAYFKRIAIEMT